MSQTKLSVIILPADKLIGEVQHLEVLLAFVSYTYVVIFQKQYQLRP